MRLLKTKNLSRRLPVGATFRKAFTLMEILIATGIFAGVMVIATGILGQSSSFRGKIKATRETSEEARRLADMITRDVRSANSAIKIDSQLQSVAGDGSCSGTSTGGTLNFTTGLALLAWQVAGDQAAKKDVHCVGHEAPANIAADLIQNKHQVLVIGVGDKYKFYGSTIHMNNPSNPNTVYYKEIPKTDMASDTIITQAYIYTLFDDVNLISSSNLDVMIQFGGYAPYVEHTPAWQPLIKFNIIAATKNYDSSSVTQRAKITIESAVTARSFAD